MKRIGSIPRPVRRGCIVGSYAALLLLAIGAFGQAGALAQETLLGVSRSVHQVVAIDLGSGDVVARIPTGKGPHEIAVASDGRAAFVPSFGSYPAPHEGPREGPPEWIREPSGTVARLDLHSGTSSIWRLADCMRPHGVEVSPDGRLVWVTCEDSQTVQELDAGTGSRLRSLPTGQPGSHELALSPDGSKLIVANTVGSSVTIIERADGATRTIATGRATEGMAFSLDAALLYALSAGDSRLNVIDLARGELIRTASLETRFPISLVVPADRHEIWISGNQSNEILVLDSRTLAPVHRIGLGTQPLGMAVTSDGTRVYVTLPRRNEVVAIDTATRREVRRFEGVMEGDGIALWVRTAR